MIGKEERGKEELERVVSYKELPIKYWRWQQMGQYKVTECVAVCIPFLLITGTWRALGWKEGIIGIALFSFYFFLLGPLNGYFLEKRVLR